MIIAPSILASDLLNIESTLKKLRGIKDLWIHLDVMDGHFVSNLTFGPELFKNMSMATGHILDAHFMVTNPEDYVEKLKDYKIFNFTFHFEAMGSVSKCEALVRKAKKYFPSVGISIRPKTRLSALSDKLLKSVDLVLLMSVEPGFAGQSFIKSSYKRLHDLSLKKHSLDASFMIQVDGGVDNLNAKKLCTLGAQNLVSGSYIFKDGPSTYKKKIESLRP